MLRRAPSSLATAIAAFSDGRHRAAMQLLDTLRTAPQPAEPTDKLAPDAVRAAAVAAAAVGLSVGRAPGAEFEPERMMSQRLSANLSGLLAHFLGEHERAAVDLASALAACEAQGRSGHGHDAFVDLSGVLIDLAINDLARGQTERADQHLKRARYTAIRAYRPDARVVTMCESARAELALRNGDPLEALQHSINAAALQPDAPPLNPHLAAANATKSNRANKPKAPGAAAAAAVQRADGVSQLRVDSTAACVRARCLRANGLSAEAVEVTRGALGRFDAASLAPPDLEGGRPLPLLHARLLLADALSTCAAGGSGVDVRLSLEHARLLLARELGEAHADVHLAEVNLRAFAKGTKPALDQMRDLPMLPPGLGLSDSDPFKLAWRPVGTP